MTASRSSSSAAGEPDASSPDDVWQFWIDVGGTFTDAVAVSPKGRVTQLKTLSSGAVQGAVGEWEANDRFSCSQLAGNVEGFWKGYQCRLLDAAGEPRIEATIIHSRQGQLSLSTPVDDSNREAVVRCELRSGEEAPLVAIRRLLQSGLDAPLPTLRVRLGTTRGTNALLTRRGARTGLLITRGFGDLPEIANQDRPKLFELNIQKPQPLHEMTVELNERIDADGHVLTPLDPDEIRAACRRLKQGGIESLAVCLLNAYRNPVHEREVAELARQAGFDDVTLSHQSSPLIKLVSRTDTAIVDAYLNPLLSRYIESIASVVLQREGSDLRLLASSGGLMLGDAFTGKDSILSGPAGGVVGFSRTSEAAGFPRAIGFDMGGTSTDVSRYSGRLERRAETMKAGVRVVTPMLAIETVAAGGGSICRFDGVRLRVGPQSAGADPGPACYGRNGPLTTTDMNLWLGRLPDDAFPFPLDRQAVETKLTKLRDAIAEQSDVRYSLDQLAQGFIDVANGHMAAAIRSISLAEGYDPRDHVMAAFGGAAPQHACAVAEELGMRQILIHPLAGVLSAVGAGMADIVKLAQRAVYENLDRCQLTERKQILDALAAEARQAACGEGAAESELELRRWVDLRYAGVDATLTVAVDDPGQLREPFERQHRMRFGYLQADRDLEIVAFRVEVVGRSRQQPPSSHRHSQPTAATTTDHRDACFDTRRRSTPRFDRPRLQFGQQIVGPALISDPVSTIIVQPGWRAEVMQQGELLLTRDEQLAADHSETSNASEIEASADPIQLELFNNRFAGIAERMGVALRSTSSSVNVKERLDFSCALFSPDGSLVVNAPHIPVHLGAMAETVRRVLEDHPQLQPGDVIVTNDPYRGGSHLPDVTVVTPVFEEDARRRTEAKPKLLFLTASRAHHAEIGGATPGSMPPFSRTLDEEGVLLDSRFAIRGGVEQFESLDKLLRSGPYPSRSPDVNLSDIRSQIAANQLGAVALRDLMRRHGVERVQRYMRFIRQAAAEKTRQAIRGLPQGRLTFSDHLDDGSTIAVEIQAKDDRLRIDFTGTDGVTSSNLNANRAIVMAAVMYSLRVLLRQEIPLNEGVMDPVELRIPEPSLLQPSKGPSPETTPAVVGGNVETSQRIVDVLLGALDLAAASQGTMNNFLFGDDTFGYYETICGGAGATADGPGAHAVHTHMTNTRITDPEIFEQRLPARLLEFSRRRGSGGRGKQPGGDGVVRRVELLQPLTVSLLTQRRGDFAPYGKCGGQAGQIGRNLLRKRDGQLTELPGICRITVEAGDQITIETPGGGGWGDA